MTPEKEKYYEQALEFIIRVKKELREAQSKESVEGRMAWIATCKKLREIAIESNKKKSDSTMLRGLLKNALTTDINNREVFMRALDASFSYEGMANFKPEEIDAAEGLVDDGSSPKKGSPPG